MIKRVTTLLAAAGAVAMLATAGPAMAQDWHHDNHWHGHDDPHWHGGYGPGYYAPPVYYAPPPVVYAPPPAYYAPPPAIVFSTPGVTVGIN
jgi:hypothetical protein